jgi:hypothetical protein
VILSTVISGSPCEIAPAVPFSDLEGTLFEVDGVAGDKGKWKNKLRRNVSVPMPGCWHCADYVAGGKSRI